MGNYSYLYGLGRLYDYGDMFIQKKQLLTNRFWKDVVNSIYYVYANTKIKSLEHVLAMPIWYNTKIITEKLQDWVNKGILTIGDMFDVEGQFFFLRVS